MNTTRKISVKKTLEKLISNSQLHQELLCRFEIHFITQRNTSYMLTPVYVSGAGKIWTLP